MGAPALLSYPHEPEPHRSFFTTDEAYRRALAGYRERKSQRERRAAIDLYVHAGIGVIMIGVVLFLVWQMVVAYLRAYPV